MNAMYFKLGQGEEALPLRDMAIKNFPNVDLRNTTIYADDYNESAILDGKYKDYGQAAFDNYALNNGEEENTYGSGYDWARVIKRVFRNDENLKQVEFDPEQGCFFCNAKDISILENMAITLKQLCENTELFEKVVSIAMSEEMSMEELLERDWQSDYTIETANGTVNISSQDVVRLMHGEMDTVNDICNGEEFEMDKFELFQ